MSPSRFTVDRFALLRWILVVLSIVILGIFIWEWKSNNRGNETESPLIKQSDMLSLCLDPSSYEPEVKNQLQKVTTMDIKQFTIDSKTLKLDETIRPPANGWHCNYELTPNNKGSLNANNNLKIIINIGLSLDSFCRTHYSNRGLTTSRYDDQTNPNSWHCDKPSPNT